MRISLFLVVFITIYSSLHVYLYSRLAAALLPGTALKIVIAVFFVIMILAPILVRMAEREGMELLTRGLAYVGFTWMGAIFLFFSLGILLDLYRLVLWALSFRFDILAFTPSAGIRFILPLLGAVAIVIYGSFAAWQIRSDHLTVATDKIPLNSPGLRLAVVSDVHLGVIIGTKRVERIMRAVDEAKPDMLISLGDLVDGQLNHVEDSIALLARHQYPAGKYAVLGNHEYFVGLPLSLALSREAGFRVLRDEVYQVNDWLILAGMDDPAGRRMGQAPRAEAGALLAGLPEEKFVLLLKHQPYIQTESLGKFDLQLSGHTHGGQIFPFVLLTRLFFSVPYGWRELDLGSKIYVNRGSGTWGPPMRFLAPPEVTIIDLVRSPS